MPIISGGKVIEGAQLRPVVQTNASTGASVAPVALFSNAGAPTVNVTLLGTAVVGSLLSDTTNGTLYICTATNGTSTIVWTVVGTQT
jgi:hypothetical protein